jgi:hypothetical protein
MLLLLLNKHHIIHRVRIELNQMISIDKYSVYLVASFYAECPAKHIQIDGCLWTKSKFLGLSVAVHMIGDATLTLLDHDERYVMTFPSAYGR